MAVHANGNGLKKKDPVLVVVQLSGGNDGLNTVVPYADDVYRKGRPSLAVDVAQASEVFRTLPAANCGRARSSLDFRGYAAADAQARWTALICSGVASPGRSGRNRAAMMVRRSLASMSSKDGSVLVVYQGWRTRRSVTSSGW